MLLKMWEFQYGGAGECAALELMDDWVEDYLTKLRLADYVHMEKPPAGRRHTWLGAWGTRFSRPRRPGRPPQAEGLPHACPRKPRLPRTNVETGPGRKAGDLEFLHFVQLGKMMAQL
jgi:hypothetical protein